MKLILTHIVGVQTTIEAEEIIVIESYLIDKEDMAMGALFIVNKETMNFESLERFEIVN